MKLTNILRRWGALALCLALALTPLAGCGEAAGSSSEASSSASEVSSSVSETSSAGEDQAQEKNITLTVVHGDGSEKEFPIVTEASTLGDALTQEGIIQGEESAYGLFITTVDGETADEGQEQWWCLTKGGEMWNYGADSTEISDGDAYELTLTVGY